MLDELMMQDVKALSPAEMEIACRELEDAYANALMDNADADALTQLWIHIQELHKAMQNISNNPRQILL